jgi:hypothetical protein
VKTVIHDTAVVKAREVASRMLAPSAGQNDKAGQFCFTGGSPMRISWMVSSKDDNVSPASGRLAASCI